MHSQNIDYAAIKDRLKSLQPKNRVETRNAQLAHLREELRNARKRGVSVNALSAELKAAGAAIVDPVVGAHPAPQGRRDRLPVEGSRGSRAGRPASTYLLREDP